MLTTSRSRAGVWITGIICLLLSINWILAVARFQPNVLYLDQWDFLLPLFDDQGPLARFVQQHGPHRQGLSFVLEGWILEATAWDARYESIWVAAVLLVAILLALRLKWRMTGTLLVWDAWIPIMGLSLGQFETIISTPNASVGTFPLALILLTANVWLSPNPAVRYLAAGALSFALTFTGFGFVGSAVITALVAVAVVRHALQRDHESAWFACGGLLVIGAGWLRFFSDYVFQPAVDGFRFPWTPLTDYLRFIALMLILPTGEAGQRWPHYLLGGTLALVVVLATAGIVWSYVKRNASLKNDVLVLLMGSGLGFAMATAIGRVSLGVAGAMTPRYLTLTFPMWLALYLGAVTWHRRWAVAAAGVCVWGLGLAPYVSMIRRPLQEWSGTIGMTNDQVYAATLYGTSKAQWTRVYLESASIEAAQAAVAVPAHPNPAASNLDRKLRYLCERGLSFFSGDPAQGDYLPWLDAARPTRATIAPGALRCQSVITKKTGSIAGFVFEDRNRDMKPDAGDPRLSLIVVQLHTPDGKDVLATAVSDDNGAFRFLDRSPGDYRVTVMVPDDYERSSDDSFIVSVNPEGTSIEARFGLAKR